MFYVGPDSPLSCADTAIDKEMELQKLNTLLKCAIDNKRSSDETFDMAVTDDSNDYGKRGCRRSTVGQCRHYRDAI